jgi:hypothetical protein
VHRQGQEGPITATSYGPSARCFDERIAVSELGLLDLWPRTDEDEGVRQLVFEPAADFG